jgi:formamidopyrimidine-DNA glycosylase
MPELPEVETIVRGLRPALPGKTIQQLEILHSDVLRQPTMDFSVRLQGRAFESVHRRGKNIVAHLTGDTVLVVNLGMTGRLVLAQDETLTTHPAVRFFLSAGPVLVYDDVRRFGAVEAMDEAEWTARDRRLGPEPLSASFTARRLHTDLSRSISPIRSWLLDQRRVAGVGNIYANEALHLAGIHPQRPASSLTEGEARKLHGAIRRTLRRAVENRGTTLRDYRDASGNPGDNAAHLRVYGRDQEPCLRCSTRICRLVFGNRTAFFCPSCQPGGPSYQPGGAGEIE